MPSQTIAKGKSYAETKVQFWYKPEDRRINVKIPGVIPIRAYQPHQPEYADYSLLLKAAGRWPSGAIEPV